MEAVSTSETSVNFYQTTRRNISEDRHHTHRRENLKSHQITLTFEASIWKRICKLLYHYEQNGHPKKKDVTISILASGTGQWCDDCMIRSDKIIAKSLRCCSIGCEMKQTLNSEKQAMYIWQKSRTPDDVRAWGCCKYDSVSESAHALCLQLTGFLVTHIQSTLSNKLIPWTVHIFSADREDPCCNPKDHHSVPHAPHWTLSWDNWIQHTSSDSTSWKLILMSFNVLLSLPCCLFPWRFQTKTVYRQSSFYAIDAFLKTVTYTEIA
jgi:hypothetical protein